METLKRAARTEDGRSDAPPIRIVHLGLGAFHRAHQAWYTHIANKMGREPWGIAAFTGRSPQVAELLQPQGGLYTLITRNPGMDTAQIIESISEALDGGEMLRWCELMSSPATAIVTLTITEAGYRYDPTTGLNYRDAAVAADIEKLRSQGQMCPSTAVGRLVLGLRARHNSGTRGLAIVSCDNLSQNGKITRSVVLQMAMAVDPELAAWIDAKVSFVSTVVDRITPATTGEDLRVAARLIGLQDRAPVVTEPFSEWIICGEFPAGRPAWECAGAKFVEDITPYEERKLWLLNAGHSLLAYVGILRGHRTIAEAMDDEVCLRLLEQLWQDAAVVLPFPAEEIRVATSVLCRRFSNPRIRHQLTQIAKDGSQKIPIRVLPVIDRRVAAGLGVGQGEAALIAAWLLHLRSATSNFSDANAQELISTLGRELEQDAMTMVRFLAPNLVNPTPLVSAIAERAHWLADLTGGTTRI